MSDQEYIERLERVVSLFCAAPTEYDEMEDVPPPPQWLKRDPEAQRRGVLLLHRPTTYGHRGDPLDLADPDLHRAVQRALGR